jgi:hypothetical protein
MTMDQSLDKPFAELAERVEGRYWGKYRGLVEDVDDREKLGRIVARVPSVYGDELSPPAWPAVPFAGPGYGALMLPKKGDGVWIEFENGDPSYPLWTGCWWAMNELPTPAGPDQRVIVTPNELKFVMDDAGKKIQLLHTSKAEITLSDSAITIRFGQTKVVLDDAGVTVNDGAFKVTK